MKLLSQEISQNFDLVEDIDDSTKTLKLVVQIMDLQYVQTRDNSRHLEMGLMDEKVCCELNIVLCHTKTKNYVGVFVLQQRRKINAIVKKDELQTWETDLKEQKTYYMYNFKAIANDGQYRVCRHLFKLLFTYGTTLREMDLLNIPFNLYEFQSFEDIVNDTYDPNMLIG